MATSSKLTVKAKSKATSKKSAVSSSRSAEKKKKVALVKSSSPVRKLHTKSSPKANPVKMTKKPLTKKNTITTSKSNTKVKTTPLKKVVKKPLIKAKVASKVVAKTKVSKPPVKKMTKTIKTKTVKKAPIRAVLKKNSKPVTKVQTKKPVKKEVNKKVIVKKPLAKVVVKKPLAKKVVKKATIKPLKKTVVPKAKPTVKIKAKPATPAKVVKIQRAKPKALPIKSRVDMDEATLPKNPSTQPLIPMAIDKKKNDQKGERKALTVAMPTLDVSEVPQGLLNFVAPSTIFANQGARFGEDRLAMTSSKKMKLMDENKGKYLLKKDLDKLRQIMLEQRRRLLEGLDNAVQELQDEMVSVADPNDRASQETDLALELRERDRETRLIRKIDETLIRMEQKDYGHCDECGVEIGLKRLEARPMATLCIDCKELQEFKEKQTLS